MKYVVLAILLLPCAADALVIRDDVEDARYHEPVSAFPALVDMPGEGHGVLIAPRWVVTAAHVVTAQAIDQVTIDGVAHDVDRVVVHPGYKALPVAMANAAMASGDASEVMAFLATSDDVALLELASPVTGVSPAGLYRGADEMGRTVQLLGKGATGDGVTGEVAGSPRRGVLRRAENVIARADTRWLFYSFDPPATALPREGMTGSGDSGGPLLLEDAERVMLVGLASWRYLPRDIHRTGRYGDGAYGVRISRYVEWVDGVVSDDAEDSGAQGETRRVSTAN